jgi:hypothetical protein
MIQNDDVRMSLNITHFGFYISDDHLVLLLIIFTCAQKPIRLHQFCMFANYKSQSALNEPSRIG